MNQPEFAAIAGTTKQYVGRLEKGFNKDPNPKLIEQWAKHFNVRMEWIITGRLPKESAETTSPQQALAPLSIRESAVRYGDPEQSQSARLDDETMAQGIELLYLLADARPDDPRFNRPSWAMIQVAAKAVKRAEGSSREAMAEILSELSRRPNHVT